MDVVRLNLAHGSPDEHRSAAGAVRAAAERTGRVVGLLADLPGPKLRTGTLTGDEAILGTGTSFSLGPNAAGDRTGVSTTLPNLAVLVHPGDTIFLADGAIILEVSKVSGADVHTDVVRGGLLRSRKGMHAPGLETRLEAFTSRDRDAIRLAIELGVDLVGLSFVRTAADVNSIKAILEESGSNAGVVAKIETRAAAEDLEAIVRASDGVMVARGDLGIQMPLEDVPGVQKRIIREANSLGKPVITATQMLESMTRAPLPTRAEVSDVANAVLDGTDALMLSEETAVGEHPVDAVRTMAGIIARTEASPTDRTPPVRPVRAADDPVSWAVANAAVHAAEDLGVSAILCPTRSGATSRRVASFRPRADIVGLAEDPAALGALTLIWGVTPTMLPPGGSDSSLEQRAVTAACGCGAMDVGELAVIVAGALGNEVGTTDFMKVVRG